jgi:hypothetical protein
MIHKDHRETKYICSQLIKSIKLAFISKSFFSYYG